MNPEREECVLNIDIQRQQQQQQQQQPPKTPSSGPCRLLRWTEMKIPFVSAHMFD